MAEIKIEKKKPIWPWIIVLLLIAAVVYFVYFRDNVTSVENNATIENAASTDTTTTN
ncbi:hypothetical protein [Flavobacterium hungaricum]|uniref:hypothetical protein n=1 Tax=Flavobacterium hungaricum TaxID=2082725 RepID=UPI001883B1F9|nr:hypothetical protein [Flavobacterium hungaricum]